MPQAIGANGYLSYREEAVWGDGGSGTPKMLKAATYGESLGGNVEELISNAINASRAVEAARGGNIGVAGSVPIELPLLGIGTMLKHALGSVTTGRHVSQQPTNVTGVVIDYAESSCDAGDGTLAFTVIGTTLAWTANGDTAGTAQDVSAGGTFTLESGTVGNALIVTVTAGSLPSTDQSDADITVSATQYKHIIKRGTLPAGLAIEKAFTDINQYFVYTGCKISQMSLNIANSGFVTGSFDVLGKDESASGATVGTPTEPAHSPVVHHEASIEEGGAPATILGLDANITNEIKDDDFKVGSRYRATLQEGKGNATGTITVQFDNLTYYEKWLNETESSLKAVFTVTGGSIEFYWPKIKYFGDLGANLESAQGIVMPLSFRAVKDTTEDSDVVITIVNTEESL